MEVCGSIWRTGQNCDNQPVSNLPMTWFDTRPGLLQQLGSFFGALFAHAFSKYDLKLHFHIVEPARREVAETDCLVKTNPSIHYR